MKKLLSLMLLCTVCLVFTTCGDDDKEEPDRFVWGGDWNDPDDPNYKPEYEGKYNPIKGVWRATWKDKTDGVYFSDDFKLYDVNFSTTDDRYSIEGTGSPYEINDKAYKLGATINSWAYKLEEGYLYLSKESPGSPLRNNWSKYSRVEEKE